jgi:hypothetical protein
MRLKKNIGSLVLGMPCSSIDEREPARLEAGERVTESIREHFFNKHHTTQKAGLPNASRLYNGRDHINTHLQTCLDFSFNASLRGTTYS